MQDRIRAAVVTGGHPFDVPGFHELWRSMDGVDAYIQHMEDFGASDATVLDGYDTVCFYHMLMETPRDEGLLRVLDRLSSRRQGILVLHHAILAFPEWRPWSDLVGIGERRFGYHMGQTFDVGVADPGHPVTQGLVGWRMSDETYTMQDPGADSHVLLTVEHPLSMKALAWARARGGSRVLCLQGGHDRAGWENPVFRTVLRRGVVWCAGAETRP